MRQSEDNAAVRVPDLSGRPYSLTLDRHFAAEPSTLYAAWTTGFDRWFAAPGSMLMQPVVNAVFFFETEFKPAGQPKAQRHPHYGRFIRLIADRLVELTWVTGAGGTEGAETVVTVQLQPMGDATHLKLTHAGFAGEAARDRHHTAWPFVLDQLDLRVVA
jgi:uncharacterized protein YndB with AHSA1/START domain